MISTAKELKAEYELLNETPAETLAGDAPKADENSAPVTSITDAICHCMSDVPKTYPGHTHSTVRQDIGKVS